MLNKCTCGRYTDYGLTCVSCSMSKGLEKSPVDSIDIEELITPLDSEADTPTEDSSTDSPDATSSTESQDPASPVKRNGGVRVH